MSAGNGVNNCPQTVKETARLQALNPKLRRMTRRRFSAMVRPAIRSLAPGSDWNVAAIERSGL
jgi:hypothetical protein